MVRGSGLAWSRWLVLVSCVTPAPARAGGSLTPAPDWIFVASDEGAELGAALCTAGDVDGDGTSDLLVGAPGFSTLDAIAAGQVLLFPGSPDGTPGVPSWILHGTEAGARLGHAVSPAGDVDGDGYDDLLIGAPGAGGGRGAALLILGRPGGPIATGPDWSAPGSGPGDELGTAVAWAGDTDGDGHADVAIGVPGHADGTGRVLVFLGGPDGLADTPDHILDGPHPGARFGQTVATAGDVDADGYADLLVGAPGADVDGVAAGRVLLYPGSPTGPIASPTWETAGVAGNDGCGAALAPIGDVDGDGYADVLVGIPGSDGDGLDRGHIALHLGSPDGPAPEPVWTASGSVDGSEYGSRLAPAGDVNGDGYADFLVGFVGSSTCTAPPTVELYLGAGTGLSPDPHWELTGDVSTRSYGTAIATAGDVNGDGRSDVAVGDVLAAGGEGAGGQVLVFLGRTGGPGPTPRTRIEHDEPLSWFGKSVGAAGDVNGDGFADLIVGAYRTSSPEPEEGRAYVYLGSPAGILPDPVWSRESNQVNARFGVSVAGAGDVNGDGHGDVLVGAYHETHTVVEEGRAYLYLGGADGPLPLPRWTAAGGQARASFGIAVAGAGDVNGDGHADVIVGAHLHDGATLNEGRAAVYLGRPTGLPTTPDWSVEGGQYNAWLGKSVATAGDVNGDGFADVAIGAHGYSTLHPQDGRVTVHHGSPDGPSPQPSWIAISDQPHTYFGFSVAGAGDVNGDGFGDLLVGARYHTTTLQSEGRAYLYTGSADGLSAEPAWVADGGQANALFGSWVAPAGDLDGDGFADVVVGAFLHDTEHPSSGRISVFLGSPTGPSPTPDWTMDGDEAYAYLGYHVTGVGDVDGDGFDDLAAGAYGEDAWAPDGGRVDVYHGNLGGGRALSRSARRPVDDRLVHVPGRTGATTSVALAARVRAPAGRAPVRLEWTLTSADGSGHGCTGAGPLIDTGPPGAGGSQVELREVVDGLSPDVPYRWRIRAAASNPFFPRSPWVRAPFTLVDGIGFRTDADHPLDAGTPGLVLEPFRILGASPNPARSRVSLHLEHAPAVPLELRVFDVQGRVVRSTMWPALGATLELPLVDDRARPLPPGVYVVSVADRPADRPVVVVR